MYVNWDHHLIYLASPRTASVATSDTLLQAGFGRHKGHHAGLECAGTLFSSTPRKQWTTITTVRNHWDCCVSWLFWGGSTPPWTVRDFEKGLAKTTKFTTYDRLFSLHLDAADILWRFEYLSSDMASTLLSFDLKAPELEKRNVSGGRSFQDYHPYYCPETQRYVADRYAKEINRLGYTF